jgi:hypothetical protein
MMTTRFCLTAALLFAPARRPLELAAHLLHF